jgi:hypothetical protein
VCVCDFDLIAAGQFGLTHIKEASIPAETIAQVKEWSVKSAFITAHFANAADMKVTATILGHSC